MYWVLHKLVHHGGDGGVQHEGHKEQETKHGHNCDGAKEQAGKVYIGQLNTHSIVVKSK